MRYRMEAACGSHIGRVRTNNEDNFFFDGIVLPQQNRGQKPPLYVYGERPDGECMAVFDGMGGGIEKAALKVITVPAEPGEAERLLESGYDLNSINHRFKEDLEDIAREYRLMAELKGNANIVHCEDLDYAPKSDGIGWNLYIKMELLTPMTKALVSPVSEAQVVKMGMDLCNAQLSRELVLSVSKNNTEILLNLKGEDGLSRVLTHEIMHIMQIGCVCEQIENCKRRAGISVCWDDFDLSTTDWTWFVEGSAERNMCNLTGGDAVSYQYKMDYICSFTLSVLLREEVRADTMETICFYGDPNLLFDAFGCETQGQRDEILNMMITMEVLQSQPDTFFEAYTETYGVDPRENDETLNQFCYSLKPAVCVTLAKEFYQNLVLFLQENPLSCNDLFFLLNLFEGHLNQHLNDTNQSKAQVNEPFITAYTAIRDALFSALEADNPGLDPAALYSDYRIRTEENTLNADLRMLPEEKREFLAERAQWMDELNGLGQKVRL